MSLCKLQGKVEKQKGFYYEFDSDDAPLGEGGMGKVYKGRKMPGHMGAVNCTVQNLTVVSVDGERGILVLKGAVPGPKGGIVTITSSVKAK